VRRLGLCYSWLFDFEGSGDAAGAAREGDFLSGIWQQVIQKLSDEINADDMDQFFSQTEFLSFDQNSLTILLKEAQFQSFLEEEYSEQIQRILTSMGHGQVRIHFQTKDDSVLTVEESPEFRFRSNGKLTDEGFARVRLNKNYLFDHFIVGKNSQFAYAAAQSVSENPSSSYNPLYIYGDSGLGKTHLLQAIGHKILDLNPQCNLYYTTCEEFTNEFIHSIRHNKGQGFRDKYRNVDVLLIDDIQFLASKTQTQEEFFHTFNTLHAQHCQIVLTSDSEPNKLERMSDRIISRFQWGLLADINPPELETRLAILKKKADQEGFILPDEVALFIASRVKKNVRDLEGVLKKLIASSTFSKQPLDIHLAKSCLGHLGEDLSSTANIDRIQKAVADHFKISVREMCGKNRSKRIAYPRQVAMYLIRQMTNLSLPEIGSAFGNKHHTTVLHSIQKMVELIKENRESSHEIESIQQHLS
jgi:chromosomal replication initiator protein